MKKLAENLWLLTYPLKMLGADLKRNVTVIRLNSGKLVIHSTGPFTAEDVTAIKALGEPGWLAEALLRHDTFSKQGHEAFPGTPFLAPQGFEIDFPTTPLLPAPLEWADELDVLEIKGSNMGEYAFLHRASRTLIVADLAFNFGKHEPIWTELLLRAAVGADHAPGMSRPFRASIVNKDAFQKSMATLLSWDFDRVIVGHGTPIESEGRAKLAAMLESTGF